MTIDSENFKLWVAWSQPIAWGKILAGLKILFTRVVTWFKIALLILGGGSVVKRIESALHPVPIAEVAKPNRK